MESVARQPVVPVMIAIALGFLGDPLLQILPWGFGASAWLLLLTTAAACIHPRLRGSGACWPAVAALCALLLSVNEAPILRALDLAGVAMALFLSGLHARRTHLWTVTPGAFVTHTTHALSGALASPMLVAMQWRAPAHAALRKSAPWAAPLLRGMLLALPLLVVFGALLVAADAVFEKLVADAFDFDVDFANIGAHLGRSVAAAYAALALLVVATAFVTSPPPLPSVPQLRLGAAEAAVVFVSLDLLFLTFVLVQTQYLFGGEARVQEVAGLTYAAYARRGFFELATVAALVLPLILTFSYLLRDASAFGLRLFRALACAQVGLVCVIMASALHRMALYMQAYGLTELRFYVSVFMGWLFVTFVVLCVTLLRGRNAGFVMAILTMSFVTLFGLHAVNPAAFITGVNIRRMLEGKTFDAGYAITLGPDAVPGLVASFEYMPWDVRRYIRTNLERQRPTWDKDWRSLNVARLRAIRAVGQLAPVSASSAPPQSK